VCPMALPFPLEVTSGPLFIEPSHAQDTSSVLPRGDRRLPKGFPSHTLNPVMLGEVFVDHQLLHPLIASRRDSGAIHLARECWCSLESIRFFLPRSRPFCFNRVASLPL
jgi:hypothetical protein